MQQNHKTLLLKLLTFVPLTLWPQGFTKRVFALNIFSLHSFWRWVHRRIVSLFPGIPSAPTAITLCVSLSQMDTIQGFRWGTVTRVRLTLQMKRSPFHSDFLDNKEWERIGKKITEYLAVTEVFLKKMLLWTFSSEKFLPTCKRCWVDRTVTWTPSELDDVLPEL